MLLSETQTKIKIDRRLPIYDVHVASYATFFMRRFFLTSVYNRLLSNEPSSVRILQIDSLAHELIETDTLCKRCNIDDSFPS